MTCLRLSSSRRARWIVGNRMSHPIDKSRVASDCLVVFGAIALSIAGLSVHWGLGLAVLGSFMVLAGVGIELNRRGKRRLP